MRVFQALACLLLALPAHAGPIKKRKLTLKDLAPAWRLTPPPSPEAELPKVPPEPPLPAAKGPKPHIDAEIENGELKRVRMGTQDGTFSVEGGYLGLSGERTNLVGPSPYVNVRLQGDSEPGNWVDWRYKIQAAVVDLSARYFADNVPGDPRFGALNAGLERLWGEQKLEGRAPRLLDPTAYDDPYRSTRIAVTSALGQLGRAYGLGPVDVGWSVSALLKTAYYFPNAAADATASVKVPISNKHQVTVRGGTTHNASPIGYRLAQAWLMREQIGGYTGETSPHAGLSVRSKLGDGPTVGLDVSRQWNAFTTADEMRASVGTQVSGRPAELGATVRVENGAAMEYERVRRRADITHALSDQVEASLAYQGDDIRFGSARMQFDSAVVGLKIALGENPKDHATVAARVHPRAEVTTEKMTGWEGLAQELNRSVGEALLAAEKAESDAGMENSQHAGDPGHVPERLEHVSDVLRSVSPETRDAFKQELLAQTTTQEQAAAVETLFAEGPTRLPETLDGLADILRMISKDDLLERFAIRAARGRIIDYLSRFSLDVPVVNQKMEWSPAALVAAGHALNSRPSKVSPITAAEQTQLLEPWALAQLARGVGLPEEASPEMIAQALAERGPPEIREEVRRRGPAAVRELSKACAELVRRELNLLMLNLMLAAEQLDRLTVDGGSPLAQHGYDMTDRSFEKLDARRSGILRRAASRLQRDH